MSNNDKKTATEESMELLEEYRINKCTGMNNVPINAFHDMRTTLKSISNEVSDSDHISFNMLKSMSDSSQHYQLEQDATVS
jgi:hypothetical protein